MGNLGYRGFDPRTVQPVASRYTDYATQSTVFTYNLHKFYHKGKHALLGKIHSNKMLCFTRNNKFIRHPSIYPPAFVYIFVLPMCLATYHLYLSYKPRLL